MVDALLFFSTWYACFFYGSHFCCVSFSSSSSSQSLNRSIYLSVYPSIYTYMCQYIYNIIYMYAVGREFGPLEAFFFFAKKKLPAAEPSILGTKFSTTRGQILPFCFILEIPFLQPSPAYPETPIFVAVFFKILGLYEDSLKMTQTGSEKECYYLMPVLRGPFLCWDQIPSFAKFTVLPVGMLKPVAAPETPFF